MDSLLNKLMLPSDEEIWRQARLFESVDAHKPLQNKVSSTLPSFPLPAEAPEGLCLTSQTTDRVPVVAPSLSGNPCTKSRLSNHSGCSFLPPVQGLQKAPSSSTQSAHCGRKAWKSNRRARRLVLGDGVGLEDLCQMSLCGLVGRFSYKHLSKIHLGDWISLHWVPLLGYSPEVIYLKKGWLGFICKSPEDASLLLSKLWIVGGSSLMLKHWRLAFNLDTDYFQHRHLWVLLPGLPLFLWNEGALKAIGASLGTYIVVDPQSLSGPVRKMGRVLVAMDICVGLPETLEIEWRGRKLIQPLDYLGLPFRCNHC
jgi:hypothetical protein